MSKPTLPIYLDHAATTPTDPRVVEAMLPYFSGAYGNPSSLHSFGRQAEKALEKARDGIAQILNCSPAEIVFTSCGTESDNLALRSAVLSAQQRGERGRIISARTEHHAISHTALQLASIADVEVNWLPVDRDAKIAVEDLVELLGKDAPEKASIVSVMLANNEVGTLQPIAELAAATHDRGVLFHTDAVQAGGQLPLDVQKLGVDLLSLTAHKFYGPKGVGLLYVKNGIDLIPAQSGGGQESNRRSGTQNVPLIVGMARALELAYEDLENRIAHSRRLRDRLINGVLQTIPGAYLTGGRDRLPNHASFVFEQVNGNTLLMHLDLNGIAASSGSACNTGNPEPSEVLLTMGYDPDLAIGSLRLTVGQQTTDAEIDYVLDVLPKSVSKLRQVQVTQSIKA